MKQHEYRLRINPYFGKDKKIYFRGTLEYLKDKKWNFLMVSTAHDDYPTVRSVIEGLNPLIDLFKDNFSIHGPNDKHLQRLTRIEANLHKNFVIEKDVVEDTYTATIWYHWTLYDEKGEIILNSSRGFPTKEDAESDFVRQLNIKDWENKNDS